MIYLDTHVVVWLYAGLTEKFSETGRQLINEHEARVSPMVRLELQYLYEIQRVTVESHTIITDLAHRIGLRVCDRPFEAVVIQALTYIWTRDPFDRLIVAQAALNEDILLSKDQNVLDSYTQARW